MTQFRMPYGGQMPQLKPEQIRKLAVTVVIVILGLWGLFSCFYTVGADSEAVVLRFGAYSDTAFPGLHFKLPFGIDRAIVVPVRKVETTEFGFRTAAAGKRTRYQRPTREQDETSTMLTGDLNIANVEWTLQYKIKDVKAYLFNVADVEGTIRDVSEAVMRKLVGDRSVDEIITIGRAELRIEARELTQQKLDGLGCGVELKELNLQDVGPPEEVKEAFNKVNTARQKKDEVINQARAQRNKEVPAARGTAKGMIKEAEAYQTQKILTATGEANAILKRNTAYMKAKRETRVRLYLETMEKILGQADRKIFIDESIKGILPHLDLGSPKGGAR